VKIELISFVSPFLIILTSLFILFQFSKEIKIIRNGFLVGIVYLLIYAVILSTYYNLFYFVTTYNLSPLVEEFIKISLLYILPLEGINENREFYVFGASIGLGVSFVESLYIPGSFFVLLISSFFRTSLHVITSVINSYIVIKSKKDVFYLLLIIIPIFIHYLYNSIIISIIVNLFQL